MITGMQVWSITVGFKLAISLHEYSLNGLNNTH